MAVKYLLIIALHTIHLTTLCDCSKILAIFPIAIRSHYILGNALLRGLAGAGHDVTMISPFSEKNPPKGGPWTDIVLTGFVEEHEDRMKTVTHFGIENVPAIAVAFAMPVLGVSLTERTLNHTNVQTLLKSDETFDVVIVGQFLNDAFKAFANRFNAHLILFSSIGTNTMNNELVGNPSLPTFAPEFYSQFSSNMNFFERVLNTIYKLVLYSSLHLYSYPRQGTLVHKYISDAIDLDQVLYNVSLVLLNSHTSTSNPLPVVPSMIDIGGFHIKSPERLPEELQSFLDDAKEGVIYVSMGSHMKSKDLGIDKRDAFLRSFGKLKQKVLWKWEDDVLPGQPSNVKLGKWLPQQDILAHPNVKLFITHGGMLSTTETVYHGVPTVAIPLAGDQKMNAYYAELAGYAVVVPIHGLTEERLSSAIEAVLTNPKYRDEAQRRSRIMRDRQVDPLDNAVYWVEYVIRHNGAKHLRVAYLDLAWYQYYLLDVFAFILIVTVAVYFVLKNVLKLIVSGIRRKKTKYD